VQVVLPELMRDNTTIIFVVDDSGSMSSEVLKMQEKLTVNAQVSMLLFGDSHTTLFNFTDPAAAPWEYAIGEIKAEHGGTDINLAMQTAFDSIKDEPNVNKRIVLLSDGHGFIDAATIATIAGANIPVDTVAFGPWADYTLMAKIAQATGGDFHAAQ
jgi:Mg-chelatase subunit ChlD